MKTVVVVNVLAARWVDGGVSHPVCSARVCVCVCECEFAFSIPAFQVVQHKGKLVTSLLSIIKVLEPCAKLSVDECASCDYSLRGLAAAAFDLPTGADSMLGPDLHRDMTKFKTETFQDLLLTVDSKILMACDAEAQSKGAKLLKSLEEVFQCSEVSARPVVRIDIADSDRWAKWDLDNGYMQSLMAFATECGDGQFKQQLSWLASFRRCAQACAAVHQWWGIDDASKPDSTRDRRCIAAKPVDLVKELRLQWRLFAEGSGFDLEQLFTCTGNIRILDKWLDAKVVTNLLNEACSDLVSRISEGWNRDCCELSDLIVSWIPDFAKSGDSLLGDQDMLKLLLSNPHYEELAPAAGKLSEMRSHAKAFLCEGTSHTPSIPQATLKSSGAAIKKAVACVTITFGIYLLFKSLPAIANQVVRQKEIQHFLQNAKAKKVTLPGDIVAKFEAKMANTAG